MLNKNVNIVRYIMNEEYIAFEWPDYQVFMEENWFREETYYDCYKDVYLIPKNRISDV